MAENMVCLEKMAHRNITSANYITSVNGMYHPNRVMREHDFLYMLDGDWEIIEEGEVYEMHRDDLLILPAGRHHWGEKLCNPGNRHMYFHAEPTEREQVWESAGAGIAICAEKAGKNRRGLPCGMAEPDRPEHTNDRMYGLEKEKQQAGGGSAEAGEGIDEIGTGIAEEGEAKGENCFIAPTLLHCQKLPRVRQYICEIIAAFWLQDSERENRLSLLFNLLLCELSRAQTGQGENAGTDPMVEEICFRLQSHPQITYTAAQIAELYYICPRTLNNRFQKAFGKTFSAYQSDRKLEMVSQFLINQPSAKLHEAAVNFGFYDEFHLSKAFKKKYGLSPTQYRQR